MIQRTALLLLALLLTLTACVTARPIVLPSGTQGEVIRCHGMARSMADCYAKAGEVCPKGYDIIDAYGESHPMLMATGGTFVGGSVVNRSLIVQCH